MPLPLAAVIVIVGALVSITKSVFADKELALPGSGKVKTALLPAISVIAPPFRASADLL